MKQDSSSRVYNHWRITHRIACFLVADAAIRTLHSAWRRYVVHAGGVLSGVIIGFVEGLSEAIEGSRFIRSGMT